MKRLESQRWISSLVLSGVAAAAMSQAPFTIVHPSDGSLVREKVKIDIPAKSIPPGGYVGVFLNGALVEAVVPPLVGKYYEYTLDTKARHIPDTPDGQTDKLELVLYTDYEEKARIVDRSSVNITIGNEKKIKIGDDGIKLRYKFIPGQEMIYDLEQHIETSSVTQAQADDSANRPATFGTEGEQVRIAYTVVNAYPNGDGLLRIEPLPMKGKDYADLTASNATQQERWYEDQMDPIYMRVTPTGHEVFGAMTTYFGFDGSGGSGPKTGLVVPYPLPTLPQKAVHKADTWASRFQQGTLDPNDWINLNSIVEQFPAQGSFVGAEWERNHPCAKLQNKIEAATDSGNGGSKKPFSGDKVTVTETIWFALDTHEILKIERDSTVDRKVENAAPQSGSFGPPPGASMGGPPMGGMGRRPPAGSSGGASGGSADFMGPRDDKQAGSVGSLGPRPGQGRRPPPGYGGGMGGMRGGPGGGGPGFSGMNGVGGAPSGGTTYVRLHILQTFTLEK